MDANVSVSNCDSLGVRTEIKNIGNVRAVAAAVQYEINRHISLLEAGGEMFNETRAWDAVNKETIPMREKEDKEVIWHFVFMSLFYYYGIIKFASNIFRIIDLCLKRICPLCAYILEKIYQIKTI